MAMKSKRFSVDCLWANKQDVRKESGDRHTDVENTENECACHLPLGRFRVFDDAALSLLIDWPLDADDTMLVSLPIDCDGVGMVGVFGGDSSFTCFADFNLSMTALNEPLRFLLA